MTELKTELDGRLLALNPSALLDTDAVLVPLTAFCEAVGAEAKVLEGSSVLAVCREDLCIPLNGSADDTVTVKGDLFARLDAFAGPLGLSWVTEKGALRVSTGVKEEAGLGIGSRPPDFTLPDLYTGEPLGPAHVLGKRAVFFMWASW